MNGNWTWTEAEWQTIEEAAKLVKEFRKENRKGEEKREIRFLQYIAYKAEKFVSRTGLWL